MKKLSLRLLSIFILFAGLGLASCEKFYEKEKFDVSFYFKNSTSEEVKLTISARSEVNSKITNKKSWEANVLPDETFPLTFNIKKDLESREGGFLFKAEFPDGSSFEENTGYYTNYQFQGKNPCNVEIKKDGFEIETGFEDLK